MFPQTPIASTYPSARQTKTRKTKTKTKQKTKTKKTKQRHKTKGKNKTKRPRQKQRQNKKTQQILTQICSAEKTLLRLFHVFFAADSVTKETSEPKECIALTLFRRKGRHEKTFVFIQ
jgi:hypothetical protein